MGFTDYASRFTSYALRVEDGEEKVSTFKCIEEIEAWQKARTLVQEIYQISNQTEFSRDFALKNQIRKAAISIMSNIAEGFERSGNKEFVQFLSIAKGSIGEVRSQLFVAMDQEYISQPIFEKMNRMLMETGRMIGGMINYLSKTNIKGSKFQIKPNKQ
jgi:four helix bundle protein